MFHLTKVKTSRWISILGLKDCASELLICCDASATGYGIVTYVRRHLIGNNEAHVAFYIGKNQVDGQQKRGDSIPRLELEAARFAAIEETFDEIILVRMTFGMKRSEWKLVNPQPEIKKTNVGTAKWARNAAISLVAIRATCAVPNHKITTDNSVEEGWLLQMTANLDAWSFKASRVMLIRKCLRLWANSFKKDKTKESTKRGVLTSLVEELPRLGSKTKALEQKETRTYLSLEKRNQGKQLIIQAIQAKYLEKDIVALVKLGVHNPDSFEDSIRKESRLLSLSPSLDKENWLRAGGRLKNALGIPYESRYPNILTRKCDESMHALIGHHHVRHHHCSASETFPLKQRFFFLGGRQTIHEKVAWYVPGQIASSFRQNRWGIYQPTTWTISAHLV